MNKKIVFSALLTISLVFGATAALMATTPPPPANQYLAIYDAKFASFTKEDCLVCHISDEVLVPIHHALINSKNMMCLDCHTMVPDGTGGFVFADFRTCSVCHTATPPHTSAKAVALDCQACHGSFIDNPNDGHYIPVYPVSSVTPLASGRTVVNPDGVAVLVQGCEACHQADATAIDPNTNTTRAIFSNKDTHHGTGIKDCNLCHNTADPNIRSCEKCHGVKSLHNIQKKSTPTATIVPGAEELGYGHIGNNWDCVGCHWSWYGNSTSTMTSAVVPALTGQSAYTLTANKTNALTLTGAAFTNVDANGVSYNPTVLISNETTTLTLTPNSTTDSEIQVTVPALLPGIYNLQVAKTGVKSNLAKLTIVPELSIKVAAIASKSTVTITGSGFGPKPPAEYKSGLGVFVGTSMAKIISWSDTKIVASSLQFKENVMLTVKTINGPISKTITTIAPKTR